MYDQRFRKLEVWKKTMDFIGQIYRFTDSFPVEERYGLTSQLRRAAVSVSLNIAEGSASGSDKEFKRFLNFAHRSNYEVICGLEIAERLKFCSSEAKGKLLINADEISAMLSGLIKSLKVSKVYD